MYYQTLSSVREYVLVSQMEPKVEVFYKQDEKVWQYTVARGLDETIVFQTLQCELTLQDIYQKVEWEEEVAVGSRQGTVGSE